MATTPSLPLRATRRPRCTRFRTDGWVSREGVDAVAKQLQMNASFVFGAVSFYAEFRTTPPAELTVHWCSGPACRLKGGDNIRRALEEVLGFGMETRLGTGGWDCTCSSATEAAIAPRSFGFSAVRVNTKGLEDPFVVLERQSRHGGWTLTRERRNRAGRRLKDVAATEAS